VVGPVVVWAVRDGLLPVVMTASGSRLEFESFKNLSPAAIE
jgi:hypothetical protein